METQEKIMRETRKLLGLPCTKAYMKRLSYASEKLTDKEIKTLERELSEVLK